MTDQEFDKRVDELAGGLMWRPWLLWRTWLRTGLISVGSATAFIGVAWWNNVLPDRRLVPLFLAVMSLTVAVGLVGSLYPSCCRQRAVALVTAGLADRYLADRSLARMYLVAAAAAMGDTHAQSLLCDNSKVLADFLEATRVSAPLSGVRFPPAPWPESYRKEFADEVLKFWRLAGPDTGDLPCRTKNLSYRTNARSAGPTP